MKEERAEKALFSGSGRTVPAAPFGEAFGRPLVLLLRALEADGSAAKAMQTFYINTNV